MTQNAQTPPGDAGIRHLREDTAAASHRWTPLTFALDTWDGTLRVEVAGELDLDSAPRLGAYLDGLSNDGTSISLDLADVTFIDLAGLRVLLSARRAARARGRQLHIAVPGIACARLLELTQSTDLLGDD